MRACSSDSISTVDVNIDTFSYGVSTGRDSIPQFVIAATL